MPKIITIGKIIRPPISKNGRLTRPRVRPRTPKINLKTNFISGMPMKKAPIIKSKVNILNSF